MMTLKRLEISIALIGAIASVLGLVLSLAWLLDFRKEILVSTVTVVVSAAVGIFSSFLSKSVRKLSFGKRAFLSYQQPYERYVGKLTESLRKEGTKVWISKDRIKPGDSWKKEIRAAMDDADTFIILLGKDLSQNTIYEIKLAKEKGKRIIPVLLEDIQLPPDLSDIKYVDLRWNKEEGLKTVVEAV